MARLIVDMKEVTKKEIEKRAKKIGASIKQYILLGLELDLIEWPAKDITKEAKK